MEVVKAFNDNNVGMEITIRGTHEEPLFRASDIGSILEMSNIRATIKDFDESQKGVNSIDTLGGEQEVTFLTEQGLYEVLFRSRKPIAKKFKKWVYEVIKEIRLTGQYKLEKELGEAKHQIEEKTQEVKEKVKELVIKISENEQRVIDYFDKIVYAGVAEIITTNGEKHIFIKFGYTNEVEKRLKTHKREIGKHFTFEIVIPSIYNIEIEKMIKNIEPLNQRIIKSDEIKTKNGRTVTGKLINGKLQTEIIKLDENFTMNDLRIVLKEFKEKAEKNLEKEIEKLKHEKLKLENEKLKLTDKINSQNIDIKNLKKLLRRKELQKENNTIFNDNYIARNINTLEEIPFKLFSEANFITGIQHDSVKNRYLNKPNHHNGYTYRETGKPYWKPPVNFKFNPETDSHNQTKMCKSVDMETGETTYYNSITEAATFIGVVRKTLNDYLKGNHNAMDDAIVNYDWYIVETCGTWIYPNGIEENLEKSTKVINTKPTLNKFIKNILKGVLEFTGKETDKLRNKDLKALIKKYNINTSTRVLKDQNFLVELGAKYSGKQKLSLEGKQADIGYYNIKFKNKDDNTLIV